MKHSELSAHNLGHTHQIYNLKFITDKALILSITLGENNDSHL